MRVPLRDTLRRLDRHWLLNHPLLWIMRLHWVVYFWLLGLVLICLVALVLPVSFQTIGSLSTYFWAALAIAGLAMSPWVYLQARFAPQLRQDTQARTAAYLLAGYIVIFGIQLAWPYALVSLLEARISSRISESEIRKDYRTVLTIENDFKKVQDYIRIREELNLPNPTKWQERIRVIQKLLLKYYQPPDRSAAQFVASSDPQDGVFFMDQLKDTMLFISYIKGVAPNDSFFAVKGDLLLRDPRNYNDLEALVVLGSIVLLLALFLRAFQATDVKNQLAILFLGGALLTELVFSQSSSFSGEITSSTLLLLFLVGGYATFRAPQLRQKNIWVVTGMNIFVLVLAWVPLLLRVSSKGAGYPLLARVVSEGTLETTFLLLLGIVLLFALTPWIQRRYLALLAKPS